MANKNTKVSVLTPIYNHKVEYVEKCLNSLKAQTLQDIEFILIDNEAIIEAKNLIDKFVNEDSRFRVIHIDKNEGYGKAMNLGIRQAKGEFIGIVESDDYVEPNFYEILCSKLINNDIDIVKATFFSETKSEESNEVGNHFPPDKCNTPISNVDIIEIPLTHASQWCAIYRKEMLINNGIYYTETKGATHQDMTFVLKTWFFAKKVIVLNEPLYHYRLNNPNQSTHQHDIVPWGSDVEYGLLAKFMAEHEQDMLPLYYYVKSRREYLNKNWFYKKQLTQKRFKYLKNCMSKIFFNEIKQGHVDFNMFTQYEEEEYKKIANHPILYYVEQNKLFDSSETHVSVKLMKIKISIKKELLKNILWVSDSIDKRHKVLCICGIRLKFKNK
ncbi:MAG: glycosyltransferase [bacterium]|nr:glycosyltransferase [bacterium]